VRPSRICLVAVVLLALHAPAAEAELVFFSTGRVLSVKGHRREGPTLVLMLRGGGEMICESSVVARIEPDEVPYPEPQYEPAVAPEITSNGETASRVSRAPRANPRYDPIIARVAARHGVDATLVRAVIQVESAYQRWARSPKGAMGLMQLMPATARQYAVADPYDPESNIEAGTRHLKALLARLPLTLALAAYNAGEAAVERFGAMPPYPETRQYVARVLDLAGL
jgi:soluble lytic murein transglycosylase-like protein